MIITTIKSLERVPEGDLVELRIDLLPEIDFKKIKAFRNKVEQPLILTYRGAPQEEIKNLALLNPDYIDVDIQNQSPLKEKYPHIKWIVSYHNFDEMPEDLDAILENLKKYPGDFYKIAAKANSSLDTLRLLLWLKNQKNVIAIPMGNKGTFGRILAPFLGSPFTFGYDKLPTAPGQLSYKEMKPYYHFKKPAFYGLIGNPIDESPSHTTHNHVMKEGNLNAIYVKMSVDREELSQFLNAVKQLDFKGLSATMPLKESLYPFVDTLSDQAKAIGAVNTLTFKEGKIHAENTDGEGALSNQPLKNKKVIVIGAGGAAKAIIHTALKKGAEVVVVNRSQERGKSISKQFSIPFIPLSQVSRLLKQDYDILINCTPNPLPIDPKDLNPKSAIMETKTFPKETELLKAAKAKGCPLIYGYEMFIGQAVLQFNTWFPHSKILFRKFLEEAIEKETL